MAMSDCSKCWETPCVCGHEYESYNNKKKIELLAAVIGCRERYLTTALGGRDVGEIPSVLWASLNDKGAPTAVARPKMHRHAVSETIHGTQYVYTYLEDPGCFASGFTCPTTGQCFKWSDATILARSQLIDWMGTTVRDSLPGEQCPIKHFDFLHASLNSHMVNDIKLTVVDNQQIFQPFYVV